MDFGRNIEDLKSFLDARQYRWALIGGVARPGPRGILVPVPKPEHLVAMKALAIKSDPSRTFQDLADIRHLALLPGVDHDEIRRQLERHGLHDRYRELERTL